MLGTACRAAAAWQASAPSGRAPYVTVNVSTRQLLEPTFPEDVAQALRDAALAPALLTLEITEGVVMRDTEASLHRLHELKALGVRLAIDDFGTGYSSLSYLQRFPVDVLKIDKTFVDDVVSGGSHAALARTIIALGETLSLQTVAEGIETAAQGESLLALGCRKGQGYHYARPLPPEEIAACVLARQGAQ